MSNISSIIQVALEKYDVNSEKFAKLSSNKKWKLHPPEKDSDMERHTIEFYDLDSNLIYKSRVEILGMYDNKLHIWIWGWAIPTLKKNQTYSSRKLLSHGLDIDEERSFIKVGLVTSRLNIPDKSHFDIHIALSSYILKIPYIYIHEDDNVDWYMIMLDSAEEHK